MYQAPRGCWSGPFLRLAFIEQMNPALARKDFAITSCLHWHSSPLKITRWVLPGTHNRRWATLLSLLLSLFRCWLSHFPPICASMHRIWAHFVFQKSTHKRGTDSTGSQVKIASMQEDTYCSSTPPRDHVCVNTERTNAEVRLPRTAAARETHWRRPRSPSSRAAEPFPHLSLLLRSANNQKRLSRQWTFRLCKFQLCGR